MGKHLSWLQVSDVHLNTADAYNQGVVIESLLDDVKSCCELNRLQLDMVFITGDLAYSGRAPEYERARAFLHGLASASNVDFDSIFCIPGNHDVDRNGIVAPEPEFWSRDGVTRVLEDALKLRPLLKRQENYLKFVHDVFPWAAQLREGELSYTVNRCFRDVPVSIIGLNSAWVGGSSDEKGRLIVGEKQVRDALKRVENPALLIALLHHPIPYLADFDASDVKGVLNSRCDFVLHGHLHDFNAVEVVSPDSEVFYIAAGALYQGRTDVLSYNLVRLDLESGNCHLYLRRYSERQGGFWGPDTLMYQSASSGQLTFALPERITKRRRNAPLAEMRTLLQQLTPEAPPPADEVDLAIVPARPPSPSPLPHVPDPPPALVSALKSGDCVLFVGSGASVDAQLPTWAELVRDLVEEGAKAGVIADSERRELDELIEQRLYVQAAGFCRDKLGQHDFAKYIRARLSDVNRSSQTHRILADIPFRAAVTTNYDKILEFARPKSTVLLPHQMESAGPAGIVGLLSQENGFPIIKISGSLEDVESIVLTQADFRQLGFKRPNYMAVIRKLLSDYTIFFYGYGFSDPNVNFLLQESLARSGSAARPHYAVMACQGPIMKEFWWKEFNLRVITYQLWERSHLPARAFLEKLAKGCH